MYGLVAADLVVTAGSVARVFFALLELLLVFLADVDFEQPTRLPEEFVVVAVEADDVLLADLHGDPAAGAARTGREVQRLLGVHVTLVDGLVTPRNRGKGGRAKRKASVSSGREGCGSTSLRVFILALMS